MESRDLEKKYKLMFVIPSLGPGGAEKQLLNLAYGLNSRLWDIKIIYFDRKNILNLRQQNNIHYCFINKRSKNIFNFSLCLLKQVKLFNPDIVHGYLVVGQLWAIFIRAISANIILVLGIRSSRINLRKYGYKTRILYFLSAKLSILAHAFIVNSKDGAEYYCKILGFNEKKMYCIENGIDTDLFCPRSFSRKNLISILSPSVNTKDIIIIGIVATLEHLKDHKTFLLAAQLIYKKYPNAYFAIFGADDSPYGLSIKNFAENLSLSRVVDFLGLRSDMPELLSGLDILVSSSISEGFSNSIAEAMSAGVPCIATDVGDSRNILGEHGIAVPSGDFIKMAEAIQRVIELPPIKRAALSLGARARIIEKFDIKKMVSRTEGIYKKLIIENE